MKRLYIYISCLALGASVVSGCTNGSSKSSAAPSETAATAESAPGTEEVASGDSTGSNNAGGSVVGSEDGATSDSLTPAVTSLTEQPGSANDDFVGAAKDVELQSCALSDGKWKANGTVSNTSGANAKYRIYVALNTPETTDTKAVVQVDIDVADGETEKWSAEADVAFADLKCILRVERATA